MSVFKLFVSTPQGISIRVDAHEITVPGVSGAFGILPGHRPLVSALRPGLIRYRVGDKVTVAAIGVGYVEVEEGVVRVVTTVLRHASDIQTETLEKDADAAAKGLANFEGFQEGKPFERLVNREQWVEAQQQLLEEPKRVR